MCWSGEASGVLAAAGFGMTAYLYHSGEKKALWLTLFYFTLMELLQALTYIYINQCNVPMNKILTFLGYIHLAFQPFFINMVGMYFIPKDIKEKISKYVYACCWITVGCFLLKAYPYYRSLFMHGWRRNVLRPIGLLLQRKLAYRMAMAIE